MIILTYVRTPFLIIIHFIESFFYTFLQIHLNQIIRFSLLISEIIFDAQLCGKKISFPL